MKKLLIAVSMVALMGAGCAATSPTTPNPTPTPEAPAGKMSMAQFLTGSWKIKSMQRVGGPATDVSSLGLTVNFDGERVTGKVCNNLTGPYTVEDNKIKFGAVAMTKMFCEGLPGEVESAFAADLSDGMAVGADEESLVLTGLKSLNVYMFGPVK
jgi:heat shock protein HslJ